MILLCRGGYAPNPEIFLFNPQQKSTKFVSYDEELAVMTYNNGTMLRPGSSIAVVHRAFDLERKWNDPHSFDVIRYEKRTKKLTVDLLEVPRN